MSCHISYHMCIYIYIYINVNMYVYTYIALHYITLHYITLHCIALHCIALHCIALHCIALHYITLHYIALHTYRYMYVEVSEVMLVPPVLIQSWIFHEQIHPAIGVPPWLWNPQSGNIKSFFWHIWVWLSDKLNSTIPKIVKNRLNLDPPWTSLDFANTSLKPPGILDHCDSPHDFRRFVMGPQQSTPEIDESESTEIHETSLKIHKTYIIIHLILILSQFLPFRSFGSFRILYSSQPSKKPPTLPFLFPPGTNLGQLLGPLRCFPAPQTGFPACILGSSALAPGGWGGLKIIPAKEGICGDIMCTSIWLYVLIYTASIYTYITDILYVLSIRYFIHHTYLLYVYLSIYHGFPWPFQVLIYRRCMKVPYHVEGPCKGDMSPNLHVRLLKFPLI